MKLNNKTIEIKRLKELIKSWEAEVKDYKAEIRDLIRCEDFNEASHLTSVIDSMEYAIDQLNDLIAES